MPQEHATYLATPGMYIQINFGYLERSKVRREFLGYIQQHVHDPIQHHLTLNYFAGFFSEEQAKLVLQWIADNKIAAWEHE